MAIRPRRYRINMQDTSLETWDWWVSTFKDIADTRIIHALHEAGRAGMTCEEIEVRTGMRHTTTSGNLRHLVEDGDALATRRRRVLSSGRRGIVWGLPCHISSEDRPVRVRTRSIEGIG